MYNRYIHDGVNTADLTVSLRTIDGNAEEEELALDINELIQYDDYSQLVSTTEFSQLYVDNQNISIGYRDTKNGMNRNNFNAFTIPYRRIHPEGFQQWIQFGNNIRVLVAIKFEVEGDPAFDHICILTIWHTFTSMIYYRLMYFNYIFAQNPNSHKHIESNKKWLFIQNSVIRTQGKHFGRRLPIVLRH